VCDLGARRERVRSPVRAAPAPLLGRDLVEPTAAE
jgi:hypothetical protein